jgi:hypothetical protein
MNPLCSLGVGERLVLHPERIAYFQAQMRRQGVGAVTETSQELAQRVTVFETSL